MKTKNTQLRSLQDVIEELDIQLQHLDRNLEDAKAHEEHLIASHKQELHKCSNDSSSKIFIWPSLATNKHDAHICRYFLEHTSMWP